MDCNNCAPKTCSCDNNELWFYDVCKNFKEMVCNMPKMIAHKFSDIWQASKIQIQLFNDQDYLNKSTQRLNYLLDNADFYQTFWKLNYVASKEGKAAAFVYNTNNNLIGIDVLSDVAYKKFNNVLIEVRGFTFTNDMLNIPFKLMRYIENSQVYTIIHDWNQNQNKFMPILPTNEYQEQISVLNNKYNFNVYENWKIKMNFMSAVIFENNPIEKSDMEYIMGLTEVQDFILTALVRDIQLNQSKIFINTNNLPIGAMEANGSPEAAAQKISQNILKNIIVELPNMEKLTKEQFQQFTGNFHISELLMAFNAIKSLTEQISGIPSYTATGNNQKQGSEINANLFGPLISLEAKAMLRKISIKKLIRTILKLDYLNNKTKYDQAFDVNKVKINVSLKLPLTLQNIIGGINGSKSQ